MTKPPRKSSGPPTQPRRAFHAPSKPLRAREYRIASRARTDAQVPVEFQNADRGERLQRVLCDAGVGSRRHCELLVAQGRVRVNGQLITALPAWVDPLRDRIEVDGRPLRPRTNTEHAKHQWVCVLLNKPRGVISTANDPLGRPSVTDLVKLPAPLPQRLFHVGRLDADSSGLILLTNDGDLANGLMHPRYGVPKQYRVSVRGSLTPEHIRNLKEGLYLAHLKTSRAHGTEEIVLKRAAMTDVKLIGHNRDQSRGNRTTLLVTLHEGQNREIRRLMARLGYNVRRLERVAIGPLKLKELASGQWRLLTSYEIEQLRRAIQRGKTRQKNSGPRRA